MLKRVHISEVDLVIQSEEIYDLCLGKFPSSTINTGIVAGGNIRLFDKVTDEPLFPLFPRHIVEHGSPYAISYFMNIGYLDLIEVNKLIVESEDIYLYNAIRTMGHRRCVMVGSMIDQHVDKDNVPWFMYDKEFFYESDSD